MVLSNLCNVNAFWSKQQIAILRPISRGPDYRSFHFSHAPALKIGNTAELLVGCSEGQFSRH